MTRPANNATCKIEGCEKPAKGGGQGMCKNHYQQAWAARPRGECSVDGCARNVYSGDLCAMHYTRKRTTGSVGDAAPRVLFAVTPLERFEYYVIRDGAISDYAPHLGPCWGWKLKPETQGYSILSFRQGDGKRSMKAHRFAYEQFVGPIPDGLVLDHLCHNRACVNPAHLEPVTATENILRGEGMGARHARQTHCKWGHPLEGDNLKPNKEGRRRCRECKRIARHDRYMRTGR